MKRLNLTLLLLTTVTVGVTGCSGGKLRNLLSRNDYQTLEEQNAEQSGLPGSTKTQVVSAETDKNDSFFKLPRFLGGKDEASNIAPDPFASTDEPSTEESIKAYQARVDERIAREAQAASKTMSDVEKQARDLLANSKNESSNLFEGFEQQKVADTAAGDAKEERSAPAADPAASVFEEMFGKQPTDPSGETASPLIASNSPDMPSGFSEPEQALSEFDKLLQAHEQQESNAEPAISIEPADTSFEEFFADTAQPEDTQEAEFEESFAFSEEPTTSEQESGFEEFMKSHEPSSTGTDVWSQLNSESNSADVFAAAAEAEQNSTAPEHVFNDDFHRTVSSHGFTENSNPWANVSSPTSTNSGIDVAATESGIKASSSRLSASPNGGNPADAFDNDPLRNQSTPQSPFVPVSQSTSANSSGTTSPGLIIPASDSTTFFEFEDQSPAVQQISATNSGADLPTMAIQSTNGTSDSPTLIASDTEGLAVQSEVSSGGWPRRTIFLIIGCVLIAGLLFLPERQKR